MFTIHYGPLYSGGNMNAKSFVYVTIPYLPCTFKMPSAHSLDIINTLQRTLGLNLFHRILGAIRLLIVIGSILYVPVMAIIMTIFSHYYYCYCSSRSYSDANLGSFLRSFCAFRFNLNFDFCGFTSNVTLEMGHGYLMYDCVHGWQKIA